MTVPAFADFPTVAASLRYIADRLDTLADAGLPDPYVQLVIQPSVGSARRGDEATIQAVDTVAEALFGYVGNTEAMSGGSYHHTARGQFAGVGVGVYNAVSSPEVRRLQAEIDELRRQRDELAGGEPQGGAS